MAESDYEYLADLYGSSTPPLSEQTGPYWDFSEFNADKADNTLDQSAFLTLFIEQLQNQDPLNPQDPHELVAQLAQFSVLEQQYNTNELLSTIAAYQSSINSAQSLSLLGRDVRALGNLLILEDGVSSTCRYLLPEDGEVTIKVYSPEGELLKTVQPGQQTAGVHSFFWDGLDEQGQQMEDGAYTFEVVATNDSDLPMEVALLCEGPVTGIRFDDDGTPLLLIGPVVPGLYDNENNPIDPRVTVTLADIMEVMPSSGSEEEA